MAPVLILALTFNSWEHESMVSDRLTNAGRLLLALLGTGVCLGGQMVRAAEYKVEFNKTGNGSQEVQLISDELTQWWPWHTINDAAGVDIYNGSGRNLAAVWIKVKDKKRDKFLVTTQSGGTLFGQVWRRTDHTEALFLDARDWTRDSVVWNRVNDTSGETSTTDYIFEGRLFTANPTIPDPKNWERVVPPATPPHEKQAGRGWARMIKMFPAGFDRVTCYIKDEAGGRLFLASRDIVFVYQEKAG